MRQKIVAANWKMNTIMHEAEILVSEILQLLSQKPLINQTVILCPPFTFLRAVTSLISHQLSVIKTGAQNCHWEEKGAYTGEISAAMLKSCGADYVLIGHSERRQYFKETNELLAQKMTLAINNKLIPIYCCGETLIERNLNNHFKVVKNQLERGLFVLDSPEKVREIIIAYEPVWAIGTGETATPGQAQEMHAFIRNFLSKKYGNEISQLIPILYGGSCNASNTASLFSQPDIDGGLIGGASLKAAEFVSIIHSFPQ